MSHRSHLNRLRRRRPAFEISMDGGDSATSAVWLPDPDDAPELTSFGAAAGLAFACHELPVHQEALVLLATLAKRYRLELAPGHPVVPEPLVTLRPKHGMKMFVRRR